MKRLVHFFLIFVAMVFVGADGEEPTDAQIQQWVKQLGDDKFAVREEATRNLIEAGESAIEAVTTATKSEDPEVTQRAWRIIKYPEKAAIAYFEKLGGKVTVDEKNPDRPVIELYLGYTKFTNSDLVQLKRFTKLQKLNLCHTKVTDEGLKQLKGFTALTDLVLYGTKVTDDGLKHLKEIAILQELSLWDTDVSDAGLKHLAELSDLKVLLLINTKITDAGLETLKGFTRLELLHLKGTKVTSAGLEKLRKALPDCDIQPVFLK